MNNNINEDNINIGNETNKENKQIENKNINN